MLSLKDKSLIEIRDLIRVQKVTSEQAVQYYIDNIKKCAGKNAVLEVFADAINHAKAADKTIKSGKNIGILAGVPILIKDNILYEGHIASCASKFLEHYTAQYTGTAVKKLLDAGAVILGRTNMDEFAMGGSTENSAFGMCKNAFNDNYVAGGSSGGSACAVAADLCAAALGSDTGGSIRQPASFNGVVGLKGSYGRVSRYGLVAFGSSLDQIGPLTKTVEDAALIMQVIAGADINDDTVSQQPAPEYFANLKPNAKGVKIGLVKEITDIIKSTPYYDKYEEIINWLKGQGAEIVEVRIADYKLSLPVYYIIAPAEAASNLGRYDGIKYSARSENAKTLEEIYIGSRTEGFGKEVKRRIMLGNFVLSSGYYDAYYVKAKKIQQRLIAQAQEAFKKADVILTPTTFGEAFKTGSIKDPVAMYKEDMFTIIANLIEAPGISIPFAVGKGGLPLGLQLMSAKFNEQTLLNIASFISKNRKSNNK